MRIGPREPAWHDNGAEVTNSLRYRIVKAKTFNFDEITEYWSN